LTQDLSLFEKIRQSGQWWLNPWWLKENSKYYTKNQIDIAFQKLKDIFDDNWFKNQLVRGGGHPICGDLLGHFPFVLDDVVKLGLDLKEIENSKNVDRVIKSLKRTSKYLSTHSVVEMSAEIKRKGFDVLFEPKVTIKYNPDFYAKNKNGIIYFEIKTLHTSAYSRVESELMSKVGQFTFIENFQSSAFQVELEICPDFWEAINVEKINPLNQLSVDIITIIDNIAKNIAQNIIKIVNSGEFPCKIKIEKVIVSIERGKDKIPSGISMSMRPLEFEFKRAIRNLIHKAIKQLPPYNPSIIGIKLFTLESSFQGDRDLALETFQREFQDNPLKYAHIVGIILILSSYPVRYEKRVIMNPYTKFENVGQNYRIL